MKYLTTSPETRARLPHPIGTSKKWSISNFFFDFRASKEMPNTDEGLMRSLLHQIVVELPLDTKVLQQYELTFDYIVAAKNISQMVKVLSEVVTKEGINLMLFVDGLDEYVHGERSLISLLQRIQSETGLKLCLASRPKPTIQAMLGGHPNIRVQDYNSTGIEAFIRRSIDDIRLHTNSTHVTPPEGIISYILRKANGVFLWTHFATSTLVEHIVMGRTEEEIYAEIGLLPTELNGMYQRIFDKIPLACRSEASLLLLLVSSAGQSVTLGALQAIWNYFHGTLGIGPANCESLTPAQFQFRLTGILGGLIEFTAQDKGSQDESLACLQEADSTHARLLHETLRAYMQDHFSVIIHLHETLQRDYLSDLWLKVYIEVISLVLTILTEKSIQDFLNMLTETYQRERSRNARPWVATRTLFLQKSQTLYRDSSYPKTPLRNVTHLWPLFPYAVLHLYALLRVTPPELLPQKYLEMLQNSIYKSSILHTYELLQGKSLQIGMLMRCKPNDWSNDLALAASRAWNPWTEAQFRLRIQEISTLERNFLIVCVCSGSAVFVPTLDQLTTIMGTSLSHDRFAMLELLLAHHPIDNAHLMLFMQDLFGGDVDKLLPLLKGLYRSTTMQYQPTPVVASELGWRDFFPGREFDGISIFETPYFFGLSAGVFHHWAHFLEDVGFKLADWQDKAGRSMVSCVLETFDPLKCIVRSGSDSIAQRSKLFLKNTDILNAHVMNKISTLLDLNCRPCSGPDDWRIEYEYYIPKMLNIAMSGTSYEAVSKIKPEPIISALYANNYEGPASSRTANALAVVTLSTLRRLRSYGLFQSSSEDAGERVGDDLLRLKIYLEERLVRVQQGGGHHSTTSRALESHRLKHRLAVVIAAIGRLKDADTSDAYLREIDLEARSKGIESTRVDQSFDVPLQLSRADTDIENRRGQIPSNETLTKRKPVPLPYHPKCTETHMKKPSSLSNNIGYIKAHSIGGPEAGSFSRSSPLSKVSAYFLAGVRGRTSDPMS